MAIRFRDDKATQAAARLLLKADGSMNHMKLVKLLYFAERKALLSWGRPITFDCFASMKQGLVLSNTLDLINSVDGPSERSYWHEYISERSEHEVRLVGDGPRDQLSEAEEKVLDDTFCELGHLSQWELRDRAHELPEWRDPGQSRLTITIDDVLRGEGYSDEDIRQVNEALSAEGFAQELSRTT